MQTLQNKYQRHLSYHQCMPYDVKSVLPTVTTWSSSESNLLRTHNEKCECWGKIPKWKRIHRKNRGLQILWDVPIKASTKLPYNKPDTLIWNKKNKDLLSNRNILPSRRKISTVIKKLTIDVQRLQIRNDTHYYLKISLGNLNFYKKETKSLTRKLQTVTVSGTVKIVETIIRFKMCSGP